MQNASFNFRSLFSRIVLCFPSFLYFSKISQNCSLYYTLVQAYLLIASTFICIECTLLFLSVNPSRASRAPVKYMYMYFSSLNLHSSQPPSLCRTSFGLVYFSSSAIYTINRPVVISGLRFTWCAIIRSLGII